MNNAKKILMILMLITSTLLVGCVESGVVVVQDRIESSFDISKGVVYNVDLWVKNEAGSSRSAEITVKLIAENTGEVRDTLTKTVNLNSGETKQLTFTLDGEKGIEYKYSYSVDEL